MLKVKLVKSNKLSGGVADSDINSALRSLSDVGGKNVIIQNITYIADKYGDVRTVAIEYDDGR